MIDTLVISGASSKVISFIGIFRALKDKNILSDFKNIKEIHTLSIGTLFSYSILFNLGEKLMYECLLQTDYNYCLDSKEIDFDNIINTMGFFSNVHFFESIVKSMCQYRFKKDDVTLKELYEYNPKKLYVKCVNVNTKQSVHFNKDDHPDLSITKLLIMTTCIPIMFKPIEYKNNYYIDGGLTGNLPIELVTSNDVLCIKVSEYEKDTECNTIKEADIPLLNFLLNIATCSSLNYNNYKNKIIDVSIDIPTHEFDIDAEKKDYIMKESYKQTIKRISEKDFEYNNEDEDED
jgi:NTE family protein